MSPASAGRERDPEDTLGRAGRGSRPRTRRQPTHARAVGAIIVGVDRGRYACRLLTPGPSGDRAVPAMRAGALRRSAIVVGDRVDLEGDVSGAPGSLARIVTVAPRTSVLRRTADDLDPIERPIVANADQLVVVVSLVAPAPTPRLVDRFLVAAYDGGLAPVLCLSKADIAPASAATALLAAYAPLDVRCVITAAPTGAGLDELRGLLADRLSVLAGSSGVGKSTLVNALVPAAGQRVGAVSAIGRGRHTSVAVLALELPGGGWLVDTPGVRSFGLGSVRSARLLAAFPELAAAAQDCPPGCAHAGPDRSPDTPVTGGAPREGAAAPTGVERTATSCALDEALARGLITPARLASFRRLLGSRAGEAGATRHDQER